jgi:hypothetical protein
MGIAFAATASQLGSSAAGSLRQGRKRSMDQQPFSNADLERRRAASRRLAWLIGAVAVLVYVVGLFIKR